MTIYIKIIVLLVSSEIFDKRKGPHKKIKIILNFLTSQSSLVVVAIIS